ncbi:MAG: glycosyltransferase family 9 protein [Desulfobulbaceae bacterium]|nr:glycosyltransferase family 9 protein [Desulfobulbaceae bacterium]
MRIDTMRRIDRWAGIPLTFILTQVLWVIRLFRSNQGQQPATRVLCLELSEMGSTILADPAMRKLRRELGCELYFAIFASNRGSLDLLQTVPCANIFTLRADSVRVLAIDTLKFLIWTRKNRIDTVLDLELFSRFTALLCGISGAKNRVGFYRFHNEGLYRGELLTHRVCYNPHIHIAKNFVALANALLEKEPQLPYSKTYVSDEEIVLPKLQFSEQERAGMHRLVAARASMYKRELHRLVLINPNASELLPQRRWMPERYVALADKILAAAEDVLVLITGAPAEHAEAEQMRLQVGSERCFNFAGATSLRELPLLYSIALCMVTNDSGPGHFSSITDMPTFVLFGPETPALYGSLGNSTPIYAGLACSPCVSAANHRKTSCMDNACLKAIAVDQVFAAVEPLLLTKTAGADRG